MQLTLYDTRPFELNSADPKFLFHSFVHRLYVKEHGQCVPNFPIRAIWLEGCEGFLWFKLSHKQKAYRNRKEFGSKCRPTSIQTMYGSKSGRLVLRHTPQETAELHVLAKVKGQEDEEQE
jgi:hypothetical protein